MPTTVSTRKPATRKPQTLEQQLTSAMARACTAKIILVMIGQGAHGFQASVTSERDRSVEYTITRDQTTGDLVCTCPASVVCKHIGACLNEGTAYHSNARPVCSLPVTANPNRPDPEPELQAPSVAPVLGILVEQHREDTAHAARFAPKLISREEALADFPMLMDIEAEVARIEAEMELAGFCWSDEARTWVRKPTMAERAATALPADRTPETFSVFAEVAR